MSPVGHNVLKLGLSDTLGIYSQDLWCHIFGFHFWFNSCLVGQSAPSHHLNQCWIIINAKSIKKTILILVLTTDYFNYEIQLKNFLFGSLNSIKKIEIKKKKTIINISSNTIYLLDMKKLSSMCTSMITMATSTGPTIQIHNHTDWVPVDFLNRYPIFWVW